MTIRRNVLALLAVLAAAACSANSAIERSEEFLAEGYVLQAYEELEQERARQMQDGGAVAEDLQAEWEKVRFRYLLERGRQEIYADHELRGIAVLQEALQMRAGDPEALSLIDRARLKLAKRDVAIGTDHLLKRDFEHAIAAFRKAQEWKPGYEPAMEGEAKVHASVATLHGEAQRQFLDAIRKMPEFRYAEVDWHAQAALTRDPARADAVEVQQRAVREMAQAAREGAEKSRNEKNYGAALMEYRTAQKLWDGMPGIAEAIVQMENEVKAQWKTEQAQLELQADRFEKASSLLEDAYALSTLERTAINELRLESRRRQGMQSYKVARDLELQGNKQEALVAFEQIAKAWPDGLDDEATRIDALRVDIQAAEAAYAAGDAAEQKGELAAALEQFKTARTYYAKLRDVAQRIEQIEKKLAAPPSTEGAGSGTGSGS